MILTTNTHSRDDQPLGVGGRPGALRKRLVACGLGGFIVPRSDEYQGEYVGAYAERLAWLTGFTGSAGLAVVLPGRAALFVDGRYSLQAEAETDVAVFAPQRLATGTAATWIKTHIGQGERLGFDPWLHTPTERDRFEAACKAAGAELVPVEDNPLDAVWLDQPAPPTAPVMIHDQAYAGRTTRQKCDDIAAKLGEIGADAVVVSAPDSVCWLLNIRGGDVPFTPLVLSFAILYRDASVDLFVDGKKLSPEVSEIVALDACLHEPDDFAGALDKLGAEAKNVRVDADNTAVWIFERLRDAGATISQGANPIVAAKAVKNAVELDGIKAAHLRDGAALTRFLAWLGGTESAGISELAASDKLEDFRQCNDKFRGLSFPTISGAASNGAIVHYRVSAKTDRALQSGSLYLVDSGAQYLDGTTDVTRTVAIGEPSREMRSRFTLVLKGHIAIATARFPVRTTGSQLDPLARRALWRAGLDYDHGTGHGVGCYLSVHEGPQRISKRGGDAALCAGMVISNEPGYYKKGSYGIRIENLLVVVNTKRPDGGEHDMLEFETLTLAPIDLALVDVAMLDDIERAWLNRYHDRVRTVIGPLLDARTRAWLDEATRPVT